MLKYFNWGRQGYFRWCEMSSSDCSMLSLQPEPGGLLNLMELSRDCHRCEVQDDNSAQQVSKTGSPSSPTQHPFRKCRPHTLGPRALTITDIFPPSSPTPESHWKPTPPLLFQFPSISKNLTAREAVSCVHSPPTPTLQ